MTIAKLRVIRTLALAVMSFFAVSAGRSTDFFHFYLWMALSCVGAICFGTASERIGGLMVAGTATVRFSPVNAKLTLIAAMKAYHDQHNGLLGYEVAEMASAAGIPYFSYCSHCNTTATAASLTIGSQPAVATGAVEVTARHRVIGGQQ